MKIAYKKVDGKKIDGKRIIVDVERGRLVYSNQFYFRGLNVISLFSKY